MMVKHGTPAKQLVLGMFSYDWCSKSSRLLVSSGVIVYLILGFLWGKRWLPMFADPCDTDAPVDSDFNLRPRHQLGNSMHTQATLRK